MPTVVYASDHDKALDYVGGSLASIRGGVANAIAAERERCAKVVENMGRSNGRVRKPYKIIAAEIRSNRNRIEKT